MHPCMVPGGALGGEAWSKWMTQRAVGGEARGVTWIGTAIGIVGRHGTN